MPDDPRYYMDFTGTGNSLNPVHPSVLRLIMDSLRYFVIDCHVDGFRFDLASALAREFYDVDRLSAFFDTIHQDPVLSQVKLIAEPWDVGPGGYQVGNFPVLWTEWNGIYRDTVRDFWRGRANVADFATRFTGSSDLYQSDGRRPFASINFVTAHDGFTLADLVSYNDKHNEANLEGNRDGTDDNRSWNCGVEGPTDDPEINALRRRQQRNFLTTLLLSQGVPMLLGGDEIQRTQQGNNNAWCQDNELSWYDWELDDEQERQLDFTRRLIRLRAEHPVFGRDVVPRGPRYVRLRRSGRLVVPARRPADDAGRLEAGRGLHARRLPERPRRAPPDAAGRTARGRLVPAPLQRARRRASSSSCRRAASAGAGSSSSRPSTRTRTEASSPRAGSSRSTSARSSSCARRVGPVPQPFRATYRLQLGPGLGFREARELVPYLRDLGISHLYLSPVLQARSRLDARLRRRRPDAHLRGARRRGGVPRARRGRARDRPRHRPEPHGRERREPLLGEPEARAKFFDVDTRTGFQRRFFDIGHLAGVRMEDPAVFEATHALVLALVGDGLVDGLRIDHPDGLADPAGYLERLRRGGVEHVWVEKILEPGEELREWPVEGTVGYEFLNDVTALFVDARRRGAR